MPICILAVFAFVGGWTNPAMLEERWHKFAEYVEPHVAHHEEAKQPPAVSDEHAEEAAAEEAAAEERRARPARPPRAEAASRVARVPRDQPRRVPLVAERGDVAAHRRCRVGVGVGVLRRLLRPRATVGSSGSRERVPPLRWAYTFVANKYYLDALYEGVIVKAIAHPIAKAAYWVNQNVIDGIVNGIGAIGKQIGAWTYRWVDQGVVDGAVNGSGFIAEESGEALRPMQSGKVNQYGALLFGAATVGAIVLVIINV